VQRAEPVLIYQFDTNIPTPSNTSFVCREDSEQQFRALNSNHLPISSMCFFKMWVSVFGAQSGTHREICKKYIWNFRFLGSDCILRKGAWLAIPGRFPHFYHPVSWVNMGYLGNKCSTVSKFKLKQPDCRPQWLMDYCASDVRPQEKEVCIERAISPSTSKQVGWFWSPQEVRLVQDQLWHCKLWWGKRVSQWGCFF
jgi:hypothetical protein